jgi:hypothetical protein
VAAPSFLPPGPGFPGGLEIFSDSLTASNPSSSLLALAGGTATEGGAILQVFDNGSIASNSRSGLAFLLSGGGGEADARDVGPGDQGPPRSWGKAGGILLLNLTPPVEPGDPNDLEDGLESDVFGPEPAQQASAPWLDRFWQALGEELRQQPATPVVLSQERADPPRPPSPGEPPRIEDRGSRIENREGVDPRSSILDSRSASRDAERLDGASGKDGLAAVATLTGLWYAFPLEVSPLLAILRRPWLRLRRLLRTVWK